jgi:hypothetical protein
MMKGINLMINFINKLIKRKLIKKDKIPYDAMSKGITNTGKCREYSVKKK